ncbi:triose-phosphate isomerase [Buchnera aphidicola]|uniref:triose-phosphate isomerase n=1 Tax=Buchnera aphidicola TaxID=9 RepID=UPI0031B67626
MNLPLVIANWKLNGSKKIFSSLLDFLKKNEEIFKKKCKLSIAPSYIYLYKFKEIIKQNKWIQLSAQNVDIHLSGAFTGEISPLMLKDMLVKTVIIGHSERRIFHNEDEYLVAKKFCLLKQENLIPVLCIGETLEEKKNNKTIDVCKKQIDIIFNLVGKNAFDNTIIAYEPVWSIGSGKSANSKEVQFILHSLKTYIRKKSIPSLNNFYLLYGGSVNEKNIELFCKEKDIDGFLVGTACLSFHIFLNVLKKIF